MPIQLLKQCLLTLRDDINLIRGSSSVAQQQQAAARAHAMIAALLATIVVELEQEAARANAMVALLTTIIAKLEQLEQRSKREDGRE